MTRDTWRTLTENYPEIEGTDTLLGAPAMETGMKEDIRKRHGFNKTKEVFAFDEGLAEKQATFLLTARPILAALSAVDQVEEEGDETEAPDPDVIKGMLKDALACNGCIPLQLESVEELDLCTTSPSAEDHPENPEGRGDSTDIGASLEGSTMVPEPSRDSGGLPTTVTTDPTLDHPSIPTREGTSTSTLTAVDCMARVRERYRADGLSETATKVLLSSWSDSTQKRYSGPWNAWSSWCLARSICPFTAPVNSVLTFLAEIAKRDKLAYRTIGMYKSLISQTHDLLVPWH